MYSPTLDECTDPFSDEDNIFVLTQKQQLASHKRKLQDVEDNESLQAEIDNLKFLMRDIEQRSENKIQKQKSEFEKQKKDFKMNRS
jgi:hypothetical protein